MKKKEELKKKRKFKWTHDDIRIEKIILAQIWAPLLFLFLFFFLFFFFFEVSALVDVRHCPKQKPCAILRKTNDVNLRKLQKA